MYHITFLLIMNKNFTKHNNNDLHEIIYKTEELLQEMDNRYKITLQVAQRAKRKKYEDIDIIEDPLMKPIIRAIIEMFDEINQSEIIIEENVEENITV